MRILWFLWPIFLFGSSWSEEMLRQMTLEEKIGQLFVAPACPLRGEDHWIDWLRLLQEYHVGNAIVKQSDPVSQVQFLGRLQAESKLPLLVIADAEWGLAMRMSNTIAFPRNMTLGAVCNLDLIEEMGREIGRQARCVGIHMNLAPVADVNNNPANPVIHMRSFGENPIEVARRVAAYVKGMEEAGLLACVKHFPGHGDTEIDSHLTLPVISQKRERLEQMEFRPFVQAVQAGVSAVMSAHLLVPCLDPIYPASLSKDCLQKVLREELHFQGLVISDALNMRAIFDRFSPEEIALLAHRASCDLLLYGDHIAPKIDQILREQIPRAFAALKAIYTSGELDMAWLDASVLRILKAKEKLGLHQTRELPLDNLCQTLHSPAAQTLKKRLFQEAVTLIGEAKPLCSSAYLSVGKGDVLAPEFSVSFQIDPQISSKMRDHLLQQLQTFDSIVIGLHQIDVKAPHYGFSEELLSLLDVLADRSVLCLFATPYALSLFHRHNTILVGYENEPDAQYAVLKALFNKQFAQGILPVLYK